MNLAQVRNDTRLISTEPQCLTGCRNITPALRLVVRSISMVFIVVAGALYPERVPAAILLEVVDFEISIVVRCHHPGIVLSTHW